MTVSDEKPVKTGRSFLAGMSILLAIIAAMVCITGFIYCYLQVVNVDKQFARIHSLLQERELASRQNNLDMQNTINSMQQTLQNANAWHVAEAKYLINLANDQVQYTHQYSLAITLLQQADKALESSQDAQLLEVRKSLATDIANLQALSPIDITALFLQLHAMNDLVDKLQLPVQPLQPDTIPPVKSADSKSVWSVLSKIVIVRKNDANALPLVMPDEKIFLYQNLHAQLESASWGLLHENGAVYAASLANAIKWIQQYFVQDAEVTKNMLQQLSTLQKVNIQPALVTVSNTLQLFDKAIGKS